MGWDAAPLRHGPKKVYVSDPDREMLRISLEDMFLGSTVFGSTETDVGKPRNAFLVKKRTKSVPGEERVNVSLFVFSRVSKCID